jgi:pimeloyl-ACP methyl ester carboxylesterase
VIAALLVFGTARPPAVDAAITQPFASIDEHGLPPASTYRARDGAPLSFRKYPAGGQRVAVLIHGSAGSSIDMHPLALALQWDGLPVVSFAVPANVSTVTGAYSWRLQRNFEPHDDYLADIRAVRRPMHVYVGGSDQLFVADRMRAQFQAQRQDIAVSTLPGMGHSDMVTRPEAIDTVVAELSH